MSREAAVAALDGVLSTMSGLEVKVTRGAGIEYVQIVPELLMRWHRGIIEARDALQETPVTTAPESTPLGQWQAYMVRDHAQVKSRVEALERRLDGWAL